MIIEFSSKLSLCDFSRQVIRLLLCKRMVQEDLRIQHVSHTTQNAVEVEMYLTKIPLSLKKKKEEEE